PKSFCRTVESNTAYPLIQQVVQTTERAATSETLAVSATAKNLPKDFCADGFLVRLFSKCSLAQVLKGSVLGRDMLSQRELILTFRIHGFLPKICTCPGCQREHCARENR